MTNKLQELYEAHVLMGMRKQRHFATLLGDPNWHYDKASGTVELAAGLTYPVQILGTEVAESDLWLWAWADAEAAYPAAQLEAASRLRELGQLWGAEELTTPSLPRQQLPPHLLGPVALGVLGMPAYYRGALEGKNLLFLISAMGADLPPLKATEFVSTLGDAISHSEIPNHRLSVAQFVEQLGWVPQWAGDTFQVTADDGVLVLAQFDSLNRLAKLSTRLAQPA
jgi:hypothetical protein